MEVHYVYLTTAPDKIICKLLLLTNVDLFNPNESNEQIWRLGFEVKELYITVLKQRIRSENG